MVKNDQQAVRAAQVTLQNDVSQVHAERHDELAGLQGAQVAAARADEQTALAQAQQVRVQISKARIVSPIDGVVVNRNLNPGEFPGTRQIFTLQADRPRVRVLSRLGGPDRRRAQRHARRTSPRRTCPAARSHGTRRRRAQRGHARLDELRRRRSSVDNARGLLRPGMVVSGTAPLPGSAGHPHPGHGVPRHDELVGSGRARRRGPDRPRHDARPGRTNAIVVGLAARRDGRRERPARARRRPTASARSARRGEVAQRCR